VAIVITDSATTGTLFIRATVSATAEQGALADSAVQVTDVPSLISTSTNLTLTGDVLEQRRTTNPQAFQIYNTFTDASNYERGVMRWSSNVLQIGAERAGTGIARTINFLSSTAPSAFSFNTNLLTLGAQGGSGNPFVQANGSAIKFGGSFFETMNLQFSTSLLKITNGRSSKNGAEFILGWEAGNSPDTNGAALKVTLRSGNAGISSTSNITGGDVVIHAGEGASASANAASGGKVLLDGGRGYGTGIDGNVVIGSTRGNLEIADARNIVIGTTTGTKIGTATTQKLGFYDAVPVVQPAAVADATDTADVITQLNALLARMRALGLIADT
jgi:hypothetical protein